MKNVMAIVLLAASISACNTQETKTTTVDEGIDTTVAVTPVTPSTTSVTYTPADGDVRYTNGKVVVWRNNDWVESDKDVTLENGIVVRRNGEVKRNDDVIVLEDGQTVTRSGNFFDKAGNAIEDGWDATKKGVGKAADATKKGVTKAGEAVKKAGQKVGEKAKDIVQ